MLLNEEPLCADSDVDFFSYRYEDTKAAKSICEQCPLRRECLELAMDNKERWGVWGGTDHMTRRIALAIDINGDKFSYDTKMKCPNCGPYSTQFLEIVEKNRNGTEIRCTNCDLEWFSRKSVNRLKNNF